LLGDVAEVTEEIIRNLSLKKKALAKKQGKCYGKELDIEIITNFLVGDIKNKKSKRLYNPVTYLC